MSRERQREAQARLMQSLWGQSPAPEGFDASRVEACGESLRSKRMRTTLRCCPPGLSGFEEFAAAVPLGDGGPLADAYRFQAYLAERGLLPPSALPAWLALRFRLRETPAGLAPRLWPGLMLARVEEGWLLGARLGGTWIRLVRA